MEVRTLTSADDSALGYLEHHFFGEGKPYQGDSSAIRVREADTAFSEVEQTAADIRRLGSGGEVPLPGYHRGRPEHDRLRGHH